MDRTDFDAQVQKNIRTLLSKNELKVGTPAFGIAIQVAREGFRSLSWKQRFVYLEEIAPILQRHGLAIAPALELSPTKQTAPVLAYASSR
jgi:hypothetical protein